MIDVKNILDGMESNADTASQGPLTKRYYCPRTVSALSVNEQPNKSRRTFASIMIIEQDRLEGCYVLDVTEV